MPSPVRTADDERGGQVERWRSKVRTFSFALRPKLKVRRLLRISTSKQTLTAIPDSFFTTLLSGRIPVIKDEDGSVRKTTRRRKSSSSRRLDLHRSRSKAVRRHSQFPSNKGTQCQVGRHRDETERCRDRSFRTQRGGFEAASTRS